MKPDKPKIQPGNPANSKNKKQDKNNIRNKKVASSIQSTEPFVLLRPQNIFLILAAIFGFLFVFVIPPFQVPDEASHMFRAYELTRLHLQVEEQINVPGNYRPPGPDNKVVGNILPVGFDSAQMQFAYLRFRPQSKITMNAIIKACSIKLDPGKEKFTEMTAGNYSFLNYVPQIPAIIIGRILGLNVIPMLYLGRLFALVFYILCVWYAIKIIPVGKYLYVALGLIPMSLTLAGSYSADCVINAFSFLTLALIFNLIYQQNITLKNKKLILLMSLIPLLGLLKINYLPWALLILLIPPRLFEKRRDYYFTISITFVASAVLSFGWIDLIIHNQIHNPAIKLPEIIATPVHQINLLVHNPFLIFTILSDTWAVKYDFYKKSLIGELGYLDTMLPFRIYNGYYLLLLVMALIDFNKIFQLTIKQRLIILFSSLSIFVATIVAMFVFDGVESKTSLVAEGVQGRYFIPPLIAFLFSIYSLLPFKKSLFEINKFIPHLILFLICLTMLYQTEHTLYLRYYENGNAYFNYVNE